MKLDPHIVYGGQCEAAFQFYERCLGAKILTMLSYGDSPMASQTAPEWRAKILHATLTFGDSVLFGSDVPPEQYKPPQGVHLTISVDDPAEAERLYHALAENGKMQMPIQETFWAARFGVVEDQFGVSWEINCHARPTRVKPPGYLPGSPGPPSPADPP